MCLHLSLAAVFTQNKAIQMSLNQNISFCSLCDHIHSDPLSWECQQWNPRQEFWPVHCQGKLDSLGSGINVTFCWFKISLDPLSTRQKCCFFCACWAIVWKLMEELLNAWHFALAAQLPHWAQCRSVCVLPCDQLQLGVTGTVPHGEQCQLLPGNSQGKRIPFFLKLTLLQLGVKLQLKILEIELLEDKIIKSFINSYWVPGVLLKGGLSPTCHPSVLFK